MSLAICLIATDKYKQFVKPMVRSIEKYLCEAEIVLFTDKPDGFKFNRQLFQIEHEPWPYPTLYRFHYFLEVKEYLDYEFIYYVDVDAVFTADACNEIMGILVAVEHCGFYFHPERITMETNKKSVFYGYEFKKYYAGGFFGGTRDEFFKLSEWCRDMIDQDLENGVIPVHNDETALNAYLNCVRKPTLELDPSYHYPENAAFFIDRCWDGNDFKPKLKLKNVKWKQRTKKGERI